MSNYIYLIQHPDKEGWFKVGETSNPSQRLAQLQIANPSELSYHSLYESRAANSDRDCHKALSHMDRRGEWFEGDIDEAAEIISRTTWSGQVTEVVNEDSLSKPVRRQPKTSKASRSPYGSRSFLDVACPA
jgi:hypothetical protein